MLKSRAMSPSEHGGPQETAVRLLLVEDQEELAEWLAKALRQSGHAVDVMHRGDHADHALDRKSTRLNSSH